MDFEAEDREFFRWYGPWATVTPGEVQEILTGLAVPWWIVGGWAIDAFTGRSRAHDDIDIGFFRADLPVVLEHLSPDYCVWSNNSGTLRPLKHADDLLDGARQLWVRRDGSRPWLIDLAMTPHDGDTWISPRDEHLRIPIVQALFTDGDGIRYLKPELVLAFKARHHRPNDQADLEVALPQMGPAARAILMSAIVRVDIHDPWLQRLGSSAEAGAEP